MIFASMPTCGVRRSRERTNASTVSTRDAMSVTMRELVVVSAATLPRLLTIAATDGASDDALA